MKKATSPHSSWVTPREIKIYGSDRTVVYDPMKRTGVAVSRIGASKAISIGAYNYALTQLDAI